MCSDCCSMISYKTSAQHRVSSRLGPSYPVDQARCNTLKISVITPPRYDSGVLRSVCLSVCPRAYLWNRWADLRNFLCRSPVTVAPSSSGGVAIRYVLPVLWMTSRLAVVGGMALAALRYWGRVRCL